MTQNQDASIAAESAMTMWAAAIISLAIVAIAFWWYVSAPRREIRLYVEKSIEFDPATARAINEVDRSSDFAKTLERLPTNLPPYDDAVLLDNESIGLFTTHDGKIWKVDLTSNAAEPFVDTPQMAWGIHEAPNDPDVVYVCISGSYGAQTSREIAGVYKLSRSTKTLEPLVLRVPDTKIDHEHPLVYADDDSRAPELHRYGVSTPSRPIIVCDNLEVSEDGKRIYFSEPFAYRDASVDDAIDEAIALARNGRLWRYDLETGSTRLIAEGFHFINGILYDLHPGQPREQSVLVSQTSLFRLTRFFLNGPKAGTSETVLDGITGTPDGIDRDSKGRIWLSLFVERTRLLTWVHAHAWIKPLLMRLPTKLLLSRPQPTGILVVSPDGREPLYSAIYGGPDLFSVCSAVPSSRGIYLANVSLDNPNQDPGGMRRLKWPPQLA